MVLRNRLLALSLLLVGLAGALALPAKSAAFAIALPLLAVVVGRRFSLSVVRQSLFSIFAATLGLVAPTILQEAPRLHSILLLSERRTLFYFAVLSLSVARSVMKEPRFGTKATIAGTLIALAAAGGANGGPYYGVLSAGVCVLSLAALSLDDRQRQERPFSSAGKAIAVVVAVVLTAGLTVLSYRTLPDLQQAAMARFYAGLRQSRIGFTDELKLGSLYEMLSDDEVVLRLRGKERPERLRGAVFTHYYRGKWEPPNLRLPEVLELEGEEPTGPGFLSIEHAQRPERYFLPLGASDVVTSSSYVSKDALSVYFPPADDYAKRVWFKRAEIPSLGEPAKRELRLPDGFSGQVNALLSRWGALEGTPEQRMKKIERQLQREYAYELVGERPDGKDPVLEFLFESRKGHCEYFASAGALLARAAGVPTRVISGYRVSERSPFGYSIVRKKHAHSWVEAWNGESWQSFDPTPPSSLLGEGQGETPAFDAWLDRFATEWERFDDWLNHRSPLEFGLAVVLLTGALLLIRAYRAREESLGQELEDSPLLAFEELEECLSEKGLSRERAETLNAFALRVRESSRLDSAWGEEAASLIHSYASLRYGAQGSEGELSPRLRQFAASLSKRRIAVPF